MAIRSNAQRNMATIATSILLIVTACISLGNAAQAFNGTFNGTLNGTALWGNCLPFSVHAGTQVAFNGGQTTVESGDVGVATGTSVTGNYIMVSGTDHVDDAEAIACAANKTGIYNLLASLTCPSSNNLASSDLAGLTLTPGVWCAASMTMSASTLTLNGLNDSNAVWVFQTQTTVSTATATSFILENGAKAENVYWAVGSSVTLGGSSAFVGQIVAAVSITVDSDVEIDGRLLAAAAVTFAGDGYIVLPDVALNQTVWSNGTSGNQTAYGYVNPQTTMAVTTSSTIISTTASPTVTTSTATPTTTKTTSTTISPTIISTTASPTVTTSTTAPTPTTLASLLGTASPNLTIGHVYHSPIVKQNNSFALLSSHIGTECASGLISFQYGLIMNEELDVKLLAFNVTELSCTSSSSWSLKINSLDSFSSHSSCYTISSVVSHLGFDISFAMLCGTNSPTALSINEFERNAMRSRTNAGDHIYSSPFEKLMSPVLQTERDVFSPRISNDKHLLLLSDTSDTLTVPSSSVSTSAASVSMWVSSAQCQGNSSAPFGVVANSCTEMSGGLSFDFNGFQFAYVSLQCASATSSSQWQAQLFYELPCSTSNGALYMNGTGTSCIGFAFPNSGSYVSFSVDCSGQQTTVMYHSTPQKTQNTVDGVNAASSNSINIGEVVGGVIGGIGGFAVLVGVFIWYWRSKQAEQPSHSAMSNDIVPENADADANNRWLTIGPVAPNDELDTSNRNVSVHYEAFNSAGSANHDNLQQQSNF